jgi:hypothetical protein
MRPPAGHRHLVLVVSVTLAIGGCGRIGYEPLPEGAGPADGGPRAHDAPGVDAMEAMAAEAGGDSPGDVTSEPDADAACSMSAAVDYCQRIPPLPAAPVIDGVLDCGPTLVPIVPEDWRGAAPLPPFPAGNSAAVAAAWRPDGLYVFMEVTTGVAVPADPPSLDYRGAGVELFVDDDGSFASPPNYDNPGTMQMIAVSPPYALPDASAGSCPDASADASVDVSSDAKTDASSDASADALSDALTDAPKDAWSDAATTGQRAERWRGGTNLGPWTSTQFGTFPTPGGFVFEGFVVASDLGLSSWSLAPGKMVGFDVAVDVSFPTVCTTGLDGHRAGQYFLHVSVAPADAAPDAAAIGPPFVDTRSFCTPTLTAM